MNVAEIEEYLVDFQKKSLPGLVEREHSKPLPNKILSFIGPRRAGKTFLLFQIMGELLGAGIPKEKLVYLNFEDPRLFGLSHTEIREIIKIHWKLYPASAKGDIFVFVDEPQNVKNWENSVRSMHDEGYKVYVTGSSSKLLSREIATSLRGRSVSQLVLPFSFKESLALKKISLDRERLGSKDKAILLGALDEYLEFGGFPEIIMQQEKENKLRVATEYFNLTVFKDIMERHKLKNTALAQYLLKTLISASSKEYSVHKIYSTIKSQGLKVSKNTLYTYISFIEDCFFAFFVPRLSFSARKKELSINKAYLCDNVFAKLTETGSDRGKKMENTVFLELLRRKKTLTEICYWKDQQQNEVDFAIKKGGKKKKIIKI